MFGLGTTELIIIAVILFFLFGAKRLPEIGKGLGGAIREFRKVKGEMGSNEATNEGQAPEKALADKNGAPGKEAEPGEEILEQTQEKVEKK